MFRLHGARFAAAAATALAARRTTACGLVRTPLRRLNTACPMMLSSVYVGRHFFTQAPSPLSTHTFAGCRRTTSTVTVNTTPVHSLNFLRGARLTANAMSSAGTQIMQFRAFRAKGQERASVEQEDAKQQQKSGDEAKEKGRQQEENKDGKAKVEGENAEVGSTGNGGKKGEGKGKASPKKKSFMDHIHGLREDYAKFPDIYNAANMINFVVFTVFCLCSTGSNSEEKWWMTQWGLDNSFRPWTWFLHSFLTNNFLSMTYAMMLLHTMCHHVLPTLGSRGLTLYVGSTAVISGAIMWLGNYLYYGSVAAPEKQFGPWDVVGALFVMEYFYYGLTPFTILNSFNGWIKYAVWVGEICILYFDWQPTVVGTLVGLALCRGVPRFKVMKTTAAGGAK